VVYDELENCYREFRPHQVDELIDCLSSADLLISHSGLRRDLPVLGCVAGNERVAPLYKLRKIDPQAASSDTADDSALPSIARVLNLLILAKPAGAGLASERQRTAVERLAMGIPPPDMSSDQASTILSAVSYARGVSNQIGRSINPEQTRLLEAKLVEFIASDPKLVERVTAWNKRSFARGGGDVASPKRDEHWDKVFEEARRLLE
jgi:hypothetical protein